MNLKKSISLFVMLFAATTVAFAANNTRNVYSVYSDNFNGTHIYGDKDEHGNPISVPESDTDGIKFYPWDTSGWEPATPHIIMSAIAVDSTASDPAPEGNQYIRYLWGSTEQSYSTTYVGCSYTRVSGVSSKASINMSAYAGGKIKFSARSNKEYAKKCKIGFEANGTQSWFATTLTNINENWQEFSFDLPSSIGDVSVLFMAMIDGEPAHTIGEPFLEIDNIRWVKSGNPVEFSVTTKNVSNNSEVAEGTISFAADAFGKGWSVAEQYLEMDVDGEFQNNNWKIRVYTNNDINGLYNIDNENDVLPMAWKISCSTLPYVYTDYDAQGNPFQNKNTYEIGENKSESGEFFGLYDAGKVEFLHDEGVKWLYPWFFVKANGDTSEYSVIWQNVSGNPSQSGCHTFENTDTGGVVHEYYDALTNFYERKPKLFLACDTKKATAAKYTANLVLNLSYE